MAVPSVTVNKVCLSGMSAIGLAERGIRAGDSKFVVAGGMESMSNAPHVVRDLRWGVRIGNAEMIDVMQHDGLFCAFDQCTWESLRIERTSVSASAGKSRTLGLPGATSAEEATRNGTMAREIVPVPVRRAKG